MIKLNKYYIIYFLLFLANQIFCQKKEDSNYEEIYLDINNDKIKDLVRHNKNLNLYEFSYNNKKNIKRISFFDNYDSISVNMGLKVIKNYLVFEMRYAPKYLDKNILSFSYNKTKNDWILKSIYTESFNPMDPDLIKTKCNFEPKKEILLSKNDVDDIIQYMGFEVMSLTSSKKFNKIKCNCEKTETELDIDVIRDRINDMPILEEPKKLRLDLYFKENPFNKENLKAYNDIASKFKDNKLNNEAVYILNKVINKFPNSIESNLNIADSFWNINKVFESRLYYKKYLELMKNKKNLKIIPKRVYNRIM